MSVSDPLHASLMNGISSHVYDYDDTTPKNYSHPSSPVASALFAYASVHPVRGRDFVEAFILGFEAESRVANAVYPAHYDAGWHITGTSGVFGAATAIGKLLGLSVRRWCGRIGLAATQAAGLREMFGSMAKAFHPGRSAQNGYAAALLAQAGFTAGDRGIEGPRGFAAVQAAQYDLSKVTTGLGVDFDLRAEHLQAVSVRHREPPDDRRLHSDSRPASSTATSHPQLCGFAWHRWCSISATSRTSRKRTAGQVLRSITARPSVSSAARRASRNTPTKR